MTERINGGLTGCGDFRVPYSALHGEFAVLGTHMLRLRGSGAAPRSSSPQPMPSPQHLPRKCQPHHGALTNLEPELLGDAPNDALDSFADETMLAPVDVEAFTQQMIDDFLSKQPEGISSDFIDSGAPNDDFLASLMNELEGHAPPLHMSEGPKVRQNLPEISQAELESMLSGQNYLLDGRAGDSIAVDDFLEFSRSIADDTLDDLLDDEAMSTAGDAPPSRKGHSTEKARNGAAHDGGEATASTTAQSPAKRFRNRKHADAADAKSLGGRRVRRRVLPEELVKMIRSGRVPVARVKAAMAGSERARHQSAQRAQRVKMSFLACTDGPNNSAAKGSLDESSGKQSNKPEVVRRAPVTVAERLRSLYQKLVEARKEWDRRANLMQMLLQSQKKGGKRRGSGNAGTAQSQSDDARLQAQHKGMQQAAEDVLEASGALLLARVELRIGRIPEETVYCCQVEGKFQVTF
jgi:hypothetical protein